MIAKWLRLCSVTSYLAGAMKGDPLKNAKTVVTDTMSINPTEAARLNVATAMHLKQKDNTTKVHQLRHALYLKKKKIKPSCRTPQLCISKYSHRQIALYSSCSIRSLALYSSSDISPLTNLIFN